MSENPNEKDDVSPDEVTDPKYDNWPVEGEENENLKWLGFSSGAADPAAPRLFQPHDNTIYEGEVDEENERIVLDEETKRTLDDDETLSDAIHSIGQTHGWHSLSDFAKANMEGAAVAETSDADTGDESTEADTPQTEFQQRNVGATADHQLGFFGSYTYDVDGQVRVLEREFHVYTEGDRVRDGRPVAEVETEFLASEGDGESRAGEAEGIGHETDEIVIDVNLDEMVTEQETVAAIEDYCEAWHLDNLERR